MRKEKGYFELLSQYHTALLPITFCKLKLEIGGVDLSCQNDYVVLLTLFNNSSCTEFR